MWRDRWQNFSSDDSVRVIDPTALELLEHISQVEELRNLQNFREGVSRICPEYERWTERGQERAGHD